MKYFVLMVLCCTVFALASAQENNCDILLQGRVVEQETSQPLEFAHVRVRSNSGEFQVATNANGAYELNIPCADSIVIYVSFLGYETLLVPTQGLENLSLEHALLPSKYFFAPALVSGVRSNDPQIKERIQLETISATSSRDFSAIAASLPAVRRKSSGANTGKPQVRAYSGSRVQLGVLGVPIFAQQWGEEHAPELFPGFYQELLLLDEVSALEVSSDGVGGSLLLNTKSFKDHEGLHMKVQLSGSDQDQGGAAFVELGKSSKNKILSWRLQGFTSKGGDIRTPLGSLRNTGSENLHWSYDLKFAPKKRCLELHYAQFRAHLGIFQGAHIGNLTDLNAAIESDDLRVNAPFSYELALPRQEVLHDFLQFVYKEHDFLSGSLLFRLGRQFNRRQEFDAIRGNRDGSASMELNKTTWNSQLSWLKHQEKHSWHLGIQAFTTTNTNGAVIFIPNHQEHRLGGFVKHTLAAEKSWKLQSILRWDVLQRSVFLLENNELEKNEERRESLNAALVVEKKISNYANWRVELSSLGRIPSINELYASGLHHGAAALEFGSPTLENERAYKVEWQGVKAFEKVKVQINAFYHRINNFIYLDPRPKPVLTIRGAFPVFDQSQTNANFYGGEAVVNYYLKHFQIGQTVSFVWAQRAGGGALPQIPPFQHVLFLKHERKTSKWGVLSAQIEHQFTAQQTHFDQELEIISPPDEVHIFSLQANSEFQVRKSVFNLGVELWNMFNVTYWDYLNRQRFFAPEPGRTLNIHLKYQFN